MWRLRARRALGGSSLTPGLLLTPKLFMAFVAFFSLSSGVSKDFRDANVPSEFGVNRSS